MHNGIKTFYNNHMGGLKSNHKGAFSEVFLGFLADTYIFFYECWTILLCHTQFLRDKITDCYTKTTNSSI